MRAFALYTGRLANRCLGRAAIVTAQGGSSPSGRTVRARAAPGTTAAVGFELCRARIQMGQDLLDDLRIFDKGDDSQRLVRSPTLTYGNVGKSTPTYVDRSPRPTEDRKSRNAHEHPDIFTQSLAGLGRYENRHHSLMIRAYSQRLLPPYYGFVQIAESDRARAVSFDGASWDIQYLPDDGAGAGQEKRALGYVLDRSYYPVAKVQHHQLTPYIFPSFLDASDITACINDLEVFLSTVRLPFPAADNFEYWLLDGSDETPLALIFSCCDEAQITTFPKSTAWTALPHSKMKVANTPTEKARSEPPVNDRFQRLVAARAGSRPRAAWFERRQDETNTFPGLLVREDWQDQAQHDLCQRYLARKAPRLLMLQGLSHDERERLEVAAKQHAIEVNQYFPLYPEVNNEQRMSAIRVEARLRRHAPQTPKADSSKVTTTDTPFSKDMRILE